jgi:hypothetical protein
VEWGIKCNSFNNRTTKSNSQKCIFIKAAYKYLTYNRKETYFYLHAISFQIGAIRWTPILYSNAENQSHNSHLEYNVGLYAANRFSIAQQVHATFCFHSLLQEPSLLGSPFLFISFSTAHHTINYPVIYNALFGPIKSTILHIKGGKLRAASLLIAFMNVRRAKINCRHRLRRPPALANNLSRLVCV